MWGWRWVNFQDLQERKGQAGVDKYGPFSKKQIM